MSGAERQARFRAKQKVENDRLRKMARATVTSRGDQKLIEARADIVTLRAEIIRLRKELAAVTSPKASPQIDPATLSISAQDKLAIERVLHSEMQVTVDIDTLSKSAKDKLDAAIRQEKRTLDAEHSARMRGADEEIRLRVVAEGKEYLTMVEGLESKAKADEKLWREMINGHKPLFNADQFKTILMCLHPDGERTPEKLADAFRLFNSKKLQLTGVKQ